MRSELLVGVAVLGLAGCAVETGDTAEGDESTTADVQEADKEQDKPVTLPHAGPISVLHNALLGHPFAVAAGAPVSVAVDAHWASAGCPIHSYDVTLRAEGMFGGALQIYGYPIGTIHTEHWKIPSAGTYRLEITIKNHPPNCVPLIGNAAITSP